MGVTDEVRNGLEEAEEMDMDKAIEAGHDRAKAVFGDKYDKDKADKIMAGLSKKIKDGEIKAGNTKTAIAVMANAFRG